MDIDETEMYLGDEWKDWDTKSDAILMMSTNTDSGDDPEPDVVAPCRR